jgi:hypothetical protein
MQDAIYKDATGQEFTVKMVDHTADGSWVHYQAVGTDREYSCLIDAFKERFTKVENLR